MKPLLTAVLLTAFMLPAPGGQAQTGCTITIPAGAITNGERLSLGNKKGAREVSPSADPALMAFARLADDFANAGSFYNRVSNTPAVQEDETLRIIDEEVLFGEALACRNDDCHMVFIRPVTQIAQHWLVTIQRDSEEFEGLDSTTPAGAKFVSDVKTADEGQDSVWTKLSNLYCHLEPDGRYRDLKGLVVLCSESRR
jgi:hypothetical protein